MDEVRRGSCLCGAISFAVTGPMRPVVACHCNQCRKQSGHFFAATDAPDDAVSIGDDGGKLKWYRSSDVAKRGFCSVCGSTLFWKQDGRDRISIAAGSLEKPTGLTLERHIYCASKGDYYAIADGLPQSEQW
jgi:hypothetical protein